MPKRPFNGSPTVDGYYTTFDSSEVHRVDSSGEDTPSGSSDFSTATVTFSGTNVVETVSLMPLVITAGSGVPFDTISSTQMLVEDTSYTIALYKGKAIIAVEPAVEKDIIISGSAESLGGGGTHNVYLITGDCTITILSAGGSGDLGSS